MSRHHGANIVSDTGTHLVSADGDLHDAVICILFFPPTANATTKRTWSGAEANMTDALGRHYIHTEVTKQNHITH